MTEGPTGSRRHPAPAGTPPWPRRAREPIDEAGRAFVAAMDRLLRLGGIDPDRRFARVRGRRLHYLELGAGPTLVLLQGAGGGAANWYRLLKALSERFRVLAPDLPGFGRSEPMPIEPPLDRRAADVIAAWLDDLDVDVCDVIGTSFGGLIALRLAQRSDGRVRRLVLLDSVGLGRQVPLVVRLATLPGIDRLALRPSRTGTAVLFRRWLTSNRERLPPTHREALVDYLWRSSDVGDPAVLARALRAFTNLRGQRDVVSASELHDLRTPTLVVWGERDRFLPAAHARRAAALLPNARLHLIPDAGHSPNWEAPAAVLDAVRPFLTT